MCGDDEWKRTEIKEHKFEYLDIEDFHQDSIYRKFMYSSVFLLTLKSVIVYAADLGAVVLLVVTKAFNSVLTASDLTTKPILAVSDTVKLGVIIASVVASFILLYVEWRKANTIIESGDISYAFTSTIAYRRYAIRSYDHYCLFSQIQNSRKTIDLVAFFVYFRFKGWKRLLFAEAPRQFFNFLFLYEVSVATYALMPPKDQREFSIPNFIRFLINRDAAAGLNYIALLITFAIWTVSVLTVLVAFFMYIPLLCQIRGNLKEYCVHKIDKRVEQLVKRNSKKKFVEQQKKERELDLHQPEFYNQQTYVEYATPYQPGFQPQAYQGPYDQYQGSYSDHSGYQPQGPYDGYRQDQSYEDHRMQFQQYYAQNPTLPPSEAAPLSDYASEYYDGSEYPQNRHYGYRNH